MDVEWEGEIAIASPLKNRGFICLTGLIMNGRSS